MKIVILVTALAILASCKNQPDVVSARRSKPVHMIDKNGERVNFRAAFLKRTASSTSLRPGMFQALFVAWKYRIENERDKLMPSELDWNSFIFDVVMSEDLSRPIKVTMSPLPPEDSGIEELGFESTSLGFSACYWVDPVKGVVLNSRRPCRDSLNSADR